MTQPILAAPPEPTRSEALVTIVLTSQPAAATFYQLLLDRLSALTANAAQVEQSFDATAVHQTRVYSRRLQAALNLLPPDLRQQLKPLRRDLRRTRRTLNDVRNYDVFLAMITKRRSAARANRPAYDLLYERFTQLRQRTLDKLPRRLQKLAIPEFMPRLLSVIANPVPTVELSTPPAPLELSAAAAKSDPTPRVIQQLTQDWEQAQAQLVNSEILSDSQQLHKLRISFKRLRYTIELIDGLKLAETGAAHKQLRALQDALGEWHDLEELENQIIAIMADREFIKQELEQVRRLISVITQLRRRHQQVLKHLAQQFHSDQVTSALNSLVGELAERADARCQRLDARTSQD